MRPKVTPPRLLLPWLLLLLAAASGAAAQEANIAVIHSFAQGPVWEDGMEPGRLTLGPDGLLYGTTATGGPGGGGTIFRMTLAGTVTTVHAFNGRDGSDPDECLVLGADGAFYGTTGFAQAYRNRPSVFRMTLRGEFNTIYVEPWSDGDLIDVVVKGADGQAYGVRMGPRTPEGESHTGAGRSSDDRFTLVGDKRFAATLPNISVVRENNAGGPLPVGSLFTQAPSEPVSLEYPPPTFGGRPKQPLCGNQVADLYGRVWGPGANAVTGVGALALSSGVGSEPGTGLVSWLTAPGGRWEKNPDFAKVLTFHGQHIPAPDGSVYAIAGSEIVRITREGRAPTVLSLAPLLEQPYDSRDEEFQGLLLAADGYIYGQVVPKRVGTRKLFRFRPDGPLETLKVTPEGAPIPHFTDLLELDDGSFVGPADGAVVVRVTVKANE
jgi:uncharacterized repeat protein (TIGR03803 family)